jgi:hypothetical protein
VTVLVGVRCTDGVVIGADSIATSAMGQLPLIHLESEPKIQIFKRPCLRFSPAHKELRRSPGASGCSHATLVRQAG